MAGQVVAVAVDVVLETIMLIDERITPLPPASSLISVGTCHQRRLYVFEICALLSGAGATAPMEEAESFPSITENN